MTEDKKSKDLNREDSLDSPKKGETTMSTVEKEEKRVTRREFVKGAAIGVAGVAAAGVLSSCASEATPCPPAPTAVPCPPVVACPPCPTPWLPAKWDYEADVVIVGYGSTGMSAAIEAYDAGAKDVLVIEKLDWLGGQGRRCGGGVLQADTIVQKKFGIVDSKDDLYEYLVAVGEGFADPALLRSFANNDNVDWIIQYLGGQPVSDWEITKGISTVPDTTLDKDIPMSGEWGLNYSATPVYFSKYGFKPVMRCHWFTGDPDGMKFKTEYAGYGGQKGPNGGTGVFKTLDAAIKARGSIKTMDSTSLAGLVVTPDREVLGITAVGADGKTLYIKAKRGVILGAGGWGRNQAMTENYVLVPKSEFKPPTVPSSSTIEGQEDGMGVLAALAIGADTTIMGLGGGGFGANKTTCSALGAGGLKIDADCRVIDVNGKPIPRLYAGGRTTGGMEVRQYPNCGFGFSTAIWHGRTAGKKAAAETSWS